LHNNLIIFFEGSMINKFIRYLKAVRALQRVNMALTRGSASSVLRNIDGIIEVLARYIKNSNHYFIEVGASDGVENNTTWLAIVHRYSGIWVEGNEVASDWCAYLFASLNYGVENLSLFVTKENASQITALSLYSNPDVFSLDIDGNDYYIAEAVLSAGLKPKIFIVEYNSAFGPNMSVTIPYHESFRVKVGSGSNLYYGCSISAWKKLFARFGYTFVTVDKNGVNAIFIDSSEFDADFVQDIRGQHFAENFSQLREYRMTWDKQFSLISDSDLLQIN
jgi:hypothetical protein